MNDEYAIVETDLSRRRHRYLLAAVKRRMEGYQTLWMTNETNWDSPYLKGRYLAAKSYFDWLSNGGTIAESQKFLDDLKAKSRVESASWFAHNFRSELTAMVERVRPRQQRQRELVAKGEALTPEEKHELLVLQLELRHSFTEEQIEKSYKHIYTPGFTVTDDEKAQLKALESQHGAGVVEAEHCERLLKDPFVCGEVNEPLPPPPRAVVDETEYEDENDEPD